MMTEKTLTVEEIRKLPPSARLTFCLLRFSLLAAYTSMMHLKRPDGKWDEKEKSSYEDHLAQAKLFDEALTDEEYHLLSPVIKFMAELTVATV